MGIKCPKKTVNFLIAGLPSKYNASCSWLLENDESCIGGNLTLYFLSVSLIYFLSLSKQRNITVHFRSIPCDSMRKSGSRVLCINPLNPELNPSAQRCLTRFLMGILLLEPCISLKHAWKTNKYTNYSCSLLIMYGSSYMLRYYIAIFKEHSYCLLRDAQLRSSR
jgi:hypothetical protein